MVFTHRGLTNRRIELWGGGDPWELTFSDLNTLSHESPDAKPEAVEQSEVVLDQSGGRVAGVRVVPLVRSKPGREEGSGEQDRWCMVLSFRSMEEDRR